MRVSRKAAVGIGSAVLAGAVLGTAARLLMRAATVAGGGDTGFTWAGSAFIVGMFVAVTIPGALLATFVHRRGRSLLLVAGAAFLCLPATSVAIEDLGNLPPLSPLQIAGVALATLAIYATVLALPLFTLHLLARFEPGRDAVPAGRLAAVRG